MSGDEKADLIEEFNPEAILWDGFNDALIGTESSGKAVYSEDMMLKVLKRDEGIEDEVEALEYLSFNVFSSYVGEFTPIHIRLLR